MIVANNAKPYRHHSVDIVPDLRTDIGPMGGVEAALTHLSGQSGPVMLLPCDLPNIMASELATFRQAFMVSEAPIVFAETGPKSWHPLCAVLHSHLLADISKAIDHGERRIRNIWRRVQAETVHFTDVTAFFNVNCHSDVQHLKQNGIRGIGG